MRGREWANVAAEIGGGVHEHRGPSRLPRSMAVMLLLHSEGKG